jgi:hypothetical protein
MIDICNTFPDSTSKKAKNKAKLIYQLNINICIKTQINTILIYKK